MIFLTIGQLVLIMPIISKVFEKFIGYVLEPYFVFHDNQFGFVKLSVMEVVAERYLHLKTLWIILRIVIVKCFVAHWTFLKLLIG